MNNILLKFRPTPMFFIACLCLCLALSTGLTQLLLIAWPELEAKLRDGGVVTLASWWGMVSGIFLSPLVETAILVYVFSLARQIYNSIAWCSVIASIPIVVMHMIIDWRFGLSVMPIFTIHALIYAICRRSITTTWAFLFVAGVHSAMNIVAHTINHIA